MGLFRKTNDDAARIDELRAELRHLRQRLDEADVAKSALEKRLERTAAAERDLAARVDSIDALTKQVDSQGDDVDALTSQVRRLTDRLARPPADPPPPPPPPSPSIDPEAVEAIERRLADLDAIDERLDALSAAVTRQAREALEGQVDPSLIGDMANRLEDLSVAVATHTTQLAATRERVDAIEPPAGDDDDEALEEIRQQLGQMAERMSSLDHRLTNVSTELANQLNELSRDIDAVSQRPAPTLPPPLATTVDDPTAHLDLDELELRLADKFDMAIEDVRESQERLAAEQARYEIKFREDLAELAERLRRPRPA